MLFLYSRFVDIRNSVLHSTQRTEVCLVADFEALSYQVTTTFDTSCATQRHTAPANNFNACYRFVVFFVQVF